MFYTNWYTVAEGMGSAWDLCVHAVVPRAKGYHCTTRSRAEEDKMIQCEQLGEGRALLLCCTVACNTAGTSEQEEERWFVELDLMNYRSLNLNPRSMDGCWPETVPCSKRSSTRLGPYMQHMIFFRNRTWPHFLSRGKHAAHDETNIIFWCITGACFSTNWCV